MSDRHDRDQAPMRKVGVLWKPREGAKSLGSGSLTVNGMKQRFVILDNRFKQGPNDPDFVLMSGQPPEPDVYAERDQARSTEPGRRAPREDDRDDRRYDDDQVDGDAERRARQSARPTGRSESRRTRW